MRQSAISLAAALLLSLPPSCSERPEAFAEDAPASTDKPTAAPEPVRCMVVEETVFRQELVSNGKLQARQKSGMYFQAEGLVEKIYIQNGRSVAKGDTLARLFQESHLLNVREAEILWEKARLQLEDLLIGQGYALSDSTVIPPSLLATAKVKSGFSEAEQALATARVGLRHTVLVAPFAGKVADLAGQPFEPPPGNKPFCTLIDDSRLKVAFQIIEAEIPDVALGQPVTVKPFSLETAFPGKITSINPTVDENGLVEVQASLSNPGHLLDGMNARVYSEKQVPGQMVVPKKAVVLRQNQEVLFRFTGGEAYWTYVEVLHENSTSYAVRAHPEKTAYLSPGDTVITENNLNLAHGTKVLLEGLEKAEL